MACEPETTINNQQLSNMKNNIDVFNEVITSGQIKTPSVASDGEQKDTLTGLNQLFGGINLGDYVNGTVLTEVWEYAYNPATGYGYKVKSKSSLPYAIDATTYPDPEDDPNLKRGGEVSKEYVDSYADFKKIAVNSEEDVPDGDNLLFVRQVVNSASDELQTVQFQRVVNTTTGSNPKALRAITTINSDITSSEWAVSAEIRSFSNTGGGFTATSGVAFKEGFGQCFAGHFQVKDLQRETSATAGPLVGVECNIQAWGSDDFSNGNADRVGIDLIARTLEDGDWEVGDEPAIFGIGLRVSNSTASPVRGGKFITGIEVTDNDAASRMDYGIETKLNAANVAIAYRDTSSCALGVDLNGSYTQSALRARGVSTVAAIDTSQADLGTSDILLKLKSNGKIEFSTGVSQKWASGLAVPTLQYEGMPIETSATAGSASALPATPKGYLRLHINNQVALIPYYDE